MKTITTVLLLSIHVLLWGQETTLKIDTLNLEYKIKGIVDITSKVPQLKNVTNPVAEERINSEIKNHFRANINVDSAKYGSELIQEYGSLEEYQQNYEEYVQYDSHDEWFEFPYFSNNLICFTYLHYFYPYRGQLQTYFETRNFSRRTGKNLQFSDFLSIPKDTLIKIFKEKGYYLALSHPTTPGKIGWDTTYLPSSGYIDDKNIAKHIVALFDAQEKKDYSGCTEFFFFRNNGQINLMFSFQCAFKDPVDFCIPLKHLKPYIVFSEFKNEYCLWGNDVNDLIGTSSGDLEGEIVLKSRTITGGGSGFLLVNDSNYLGSNYGIISWYDREFVYKFFMKFEHPDGRRKVTILDILKIKREEFKDGIAFVPYCSTTSGMDNEIVALIKKADGNTEFHTKILKAWRVNRKTGKFEKIPKETVKKCYNEDYGID